MNSIENKEEKLIFPSLFLEGETFLRNKHDIAFFEINCTFFGRKENTINCISNIKELGSTKSRRRNKNFFSRIKIQIKNSHAKSIYFSLF